MENDKRVKDYAENETWYLAQQERYTVYYLYFKHAKWS